MSISEKIDRLEEIKETFIELLSEATEIINNLPDEFDLEKDRAKSYWIPHLETNLVEDHNYLGGTGCTLEETITELREMEECREEEHAE